MNPIPLVALLAASPASLAAVVPAHAGDARFHVDDAGRRAAAPALPLQRPALPQRGGAPLEPWISLGPPGGDVEVVAASPVDASLVLAGIAPTAGFGGAMYRSLDGGATWSVLSAFAGISVHDIEFRPDGSVFAGSADGLRSSSDGGDNWAVIDLGIGASQGIMDIAIDPSDANVIWVAVADALGAQPVNVMRSIDGGSTWNDRTPPLAAPMSGSGFAIDPVDGDTVVATFAGAFGGGAVWVTEDGGMSWIDRGEGLPIQSPVRAAAHDGTRFLVAGGQLFGTQNFGVFASDDLGANWTPLHDSSWPSRSVTDIAVDPADPQVLLATTEGAGVNRSSDGGASWTLEVEGTGGYTAKSVRFVAGAAGRVLLGASSYAVAVSDDGGASFTPSSEGISELSLYGVAIDDNDPRRLALAFQGQNSGGVFSSDDGGQTWTAERAPGTRYSAVAFAPDGTLYALSSGPSTIAPEGLYRREANGDWTGLGPDQGTLYESDLASIRFSRNDPQLILLGGADFGVAGFEETVWRSTDAGATWDKVVEAADSHAIIDIEIIEDGSDHTVLAASDDRSGANAGSVHRSSDGGVTWAPANAGLPASFRQPRLCALPGQPQTLFLSAVVGSGGATFRSDDAGANWSATGWTSPQWLYDIACDAVVPQRLYVAGYGTPAVLASDDAGVSFTDWANGLEHAGTPNTFAIAANGDASILALSTSKGSFATALAAGPDDTIFADGFD